MRAQWHHTQRHQKSRQRLKSLERKEKTRGTRCRLQDRREVEDKDRKEQRRRQLINSTMAIMERGREEQHSKRASSALRAPKKKAQAGASAERNRRWTAKREKTRTSKKERRSPVHRKETRRTRPDTVQGSAGNKDALDRQPSREHEPIRKPERISRKEHGRTDLENQDHHHPNPPPYDALPFRQRPFRQFEPSVSSGLDEELDHRAEEDNPCPEGLSKLEDEEIPARKKEHIQKWPILVLQTPQSKRCLLCRKYIDDAHLASRARKGAMRWWYGMSVAERWKQIEEWKLKDARREG